MRRHGILVILGLVLAFIAFQARTGILRAPYHEEPANKYTREMMSQPELTEADAAIVRERYGNAHVLRSGLRYIERRPGDGPVPGPGQEVAVAYDGYLLDGTKFDSSRDRGQPFTFRLGTGAVIKGWDEALATMRRGEQRTLIVPWWLGYGEAGRGPIPPRATLVFDVELLAIR